VQHLTESQQRSDERQAKLKDENGHFVERSVSSLCLCVCLCVCVCVSSFHYCSYY